MGSPIASPELCHRRSTSAVVCAPHFCWRRLLSSYSALRTPRLFSEAPLPSGEISQGSEKIDPTKGRPVHIDEDELGVGGLP